MGEGASQPRVIGELGSHRTDLKKEGGVPVFQTHQVEKHLLLASLLDGDVIGVAVAVNCIRPEIGASRKQEDNRSQQQSGARPPVGAVLFSATLHRLPLPLLPVRNRSRKVPSKTRGMKGIQTGFFQLPTGHFQFKEIPPLIKPTA